MMLLERNSDLRLVKPDRGVRFEMLLRVRNSVLRRIKPDRGIISEMLLLERFRYVRLVKPDRGEISEMLLLLLRRSSTLSVPKFKLVRRVANSSPVKSLIFAFRASMRVKLTISLRVIGAPLALPRRSSIAARRFSSGMATIAAPSPPEEGTSLPKLLIKSRKSENSISPSLSRSYLAS